MYMYVYAEGTRCCVGGERGCVVPRLLLFPHTFTLTHVCTHTRMGLQQAKALVGQGRMQEAAPVIAELHRSCQKEVRCAAPLFCACVSVSLSNVYTHGHLVCNLGHRHSHEHEHAPSQRITQLPHDHQTITPTYTHIHVINIRTARTTRARRPT